MFMKTFFNTVTCLLQDLLVLDPSSVLLDNRKIFSDTKSLNQIFLSAFFVV